MEELTNVERLKARKKRVKLLMFMGTALLITIILFSMMMITIQKIQGTGRVINYTGMVRGASQRLIKKEFTGIRGDADIARLDEIMGGLKHGESTYKITPIKNEYYREKLEVLVSEWDTLKEQIRVYRENPETELLLFEKSELFFTYADQAVDAAESYSESYASRLLVYEILLILMLTVILVVLFIQSIGEVELNKKLNAIAYMDPITGLPNRRSCEHELSKGEIYGEKEAVCCFMFDLNNLKEVNDTLGHSYGDLLISSFATILHRAAPKGMFVGRIAGDEFMGILRDTTEEEIRSFIESLRSEQIALESNPTNYSISISYALGYAFSKEYQNSSLRKLLEVADMEMYKDKKRYKETKEA